MLKIKEYNLGETDETVAVSTSEDHRLAITRMAQQCLRTMEIISHNLEPSIYDTTEFIEAVKYLVLQHRNVQVRILVFDPLTIVKHGHRMLDLMQNLTSFIEFRKPGFEYECFNESVFIADSTGYVLRTTPERYEGTLNFNDKRAATILRRKFDEMWEKAKPDPNLKRVSL